MDLQSLSIQDLRLQWGKAWGHTPNLRIGRAMLEKSLAYRLLGGLNKEQQERLDQLVKEYKRNPACFGERAGTLKPGTRLVRTYNGKKHNVLVKINGFEYQNQNYFSLSKIANEITGSRWNGWVFFGVK